MSTLKGRVAVVAGASRGAGRGIALGLGDAGATVYVVGRTTRGGPKPADGAPGTIDDTAEQVTQRGGVGIAVRADLTDETEVAAVFDRVAHEQGRLDVLANAVWGASDGVATGEDPLASWGKPFWEESPEPWQHMITGGPYAYFLTSRHAMRMMSAAGKGLIVGVTDGILGAVPVDLLSPDSYMGQLVWDLAHHCINRMHLGMSVEGRPHGIAVVTLMPGFMQTERVNASMTSDEIKKQFRYDLSESVEYIGRAVAALTGDANVMSKSGKIQFVADLAQEYGFTDIDGRQVPRFNPFG